MQSGISTHVFLPQRLTPALLDSLSESGVQQIEVFAARHHFPYTDRAAVREIANWFRSHDVKASLHMPLYDPEEASEWSKHTAPSLNLIDKVKAKRIAAMDEVKRAFEAAEQVPFKAAVIHLGLIEDEWGSQAIDDAMTAIEHLKAFAGPLGMQLLLENLNNAVATPEHLAEIARIGHFSTVGYCLDLGHAFLEPGIPETSHAPAKSGIEMAFEAFGEKLVELHVHDNGGVRDEHCWPGDGKIDFGLVHELLHSMEKKPMGVLEIAHELGYDTKNVITQARKAVEALSEL